MAFLSGFSVPKVAATLGMPWPTGGVVSEIVRRVSFFNVGQMNLGMGEETVLLKVAYSVNLEVPADSVLMPDDREGFALRGAHVSKRQV